MAVILNASTSTGFVQSADTSGEINLQSNGSTKLTVASTGVSGTLVQGTAVSASGTSVNFTGIPSWAKKITVMLNGTGTSTGSNQVIRFGSSGSAQTTGYNSTVGSLSAGVSAATNTTGFHLGTTGNTSTNRFYGALTLSLVGSNVWVATCFMAVPNASNIITGGQVAMTGTLDSVFITSANGTDTFNAGTINIQYEG